MYFIVKKLGTENILLQNIRVQKYFVNMVKILILKLQIINWSCTSKNFNQKISEIDESLCQTKSIRNSQNWWREKNRKQKKKRRKERKLLFGWYTVNRNEFVNAEAREEEMGKHGFEGKVLSSYVRPIRRAIRNLYA